MLEPAFGPVRKRQNSRGPGRRLDPSPRCNRSLRLFALKEPLAQGQWKAVPRDSKPGQTIHWDTRRAAPKRWVLGRFEDPGVRSTARNAPRKNRKPDHPENSRKFPNK